jgi:hypothetical protein
VTRYAENTEVPVSRSFDEIKRTLSRFGADAFGYAEQGRDVMISFQVKGLRVMIRMTLPDRERFAKNSYGTRRPETAIDKDHEKECRRLWRTLAAAIKAKLAMVDDGLSSVEREFLADVVLPGGSETVADRLMPDLREIARTGELPSLIPGLPPAPKVIELPSRSGT